MFEYAQPGRRRTRRPRHTRDIEPRDRTATVFTLVDPALRSEIDTGAGGAFNPVHANTIRDAAIALRAYQSSALLISPSVAIENAPGLAQLVASSPGVATVAVLRANQTDDEGVLALGQCGIREVVRLGEREGWKRLRSLVAIGSSASILEPILSSLEGANDEIRNFFGELVRLAPTTSRIGDFGQQVGVLPSTLMSRFFRAGLPAPKMYLSMTRLAYAALWFEAQSVSMSAVAYKLGWSSPQSFGRHIRTMLGMTATEFRKELSLEQFLMQYREQLIAPYIETLRSFRPLGRSSHQAATRHGLSMVAEK